MLLLLALLAILLFVVDGAVDISSQAYLPDDYSVKTFSTGHGRTRGLHTLPNGDVLLIKAQSRRVVNDDSSIILFWDDDNDGVADGSHVLVAPGHDLTHGIEYVRPENNVRGPVGSGLLLASSDRTVYAWPYTHGDRASDLGQGQTLVFNMNAQAASDDLGAYKGHWTRTLAVSPGDQRFLHISVGSRGNVDFDSYRSRIRRIDLNNTEVDSFDFREAEIFADGLRNEVGLDFDSKGILWGVENGADRLVRNDIGGDIHEDNPAEELNKFDEVGKFYGYPYCFSEYNIPRFGLGRGTQWAWPWYRTDYGSNWGKNDEWCRTRSQGPALAMQGHSAPLGMAFYDYSKYDAAKCNGTGTFPPVADGDLFVGFHGSWNRDVPTGYKVVHIPFDGPGGMPIGEVNDLLAHAGTGAKWPSGVRPVDVQFDQCGRLLVTDDGTQSIFTITYDGISFPAPVTADSDEVVVVDNSTQTVTESNTTEQVDNTTLIDGGYESDSGMMDNNSMSATAGFDLDASDSSTFIPDEGTAAMSEEPEGRLSSSAAALFGAQTTSVAGVPALRVFAAIMAGVALGW